MDPGGDTGPVTRTNSSLSGSSRRRMLKNICSSALAFTISGCSRLTSRHTPDGEVVVSSRHDWLSGGKDGTRISDDGALVLDDIVLVSDDFNWGSPNESDFDWNFRLDEGTDIVPNPEGGYVEFLAETPDNQAYMEQQNNSYYDLSRHPDWRLNVVERNTQSRVGSAWEFFFTTVNGPGSRPWVLIDAGGGDDVPNTESSDDSCGEGFYTRTDQILTHFESDSGNRYFCWDEFSDAPIDHSRKRKLSLEISGSLGEMKAYVDDRLQADLRASEGHHIITDKLIRPMMKLHNRGDPDERGYVYHVDVQKVGVKQSTGVYTKRLSAGHSVDWVTVDIDYELPEGCAVNADYFDASDSSRVYSDISAVPTCESLGVRLELRTTRDWATPRVNSLKAAFSS